MQLVLRRLWIQITSDRKRFSLLCAMLIIGLLLWGRIIVTSNLPRMAVADDPVRNVGTPGPGGGSDKHVKRTVEVTFARTPNRDPLLISDQHFPKPTPVELLGQDNPKFGPDAAENQQQADARFTRELRRLVGTLKLEGVMQDTMAVINGNTIRLNDWVAAGKPGQALFQLTEIGHRSVTLECEHRRFRLQMDYPGTEER
ncbi:MAG: hypothetical protein V3S08_02080 [Phycisphaerales bacterium]